MSLERSAIFEWAAAGRLPRESVERALALAGATPDAVAWRRFLDRLLLGGGVVLAASGVIFFVAANWQALGRFGKFALVEAPIAVAIAVCAWRGLESTVGRMALLAAALCTGALLALVGQTYQTGANTNELAAAWALAILAWVAVARFPALWLMWLAIVDLGVALYFDTFGRWLGVVFGARESLWALFALDTVALAVWETFAAAGEAILAGLRDASLAPLGSAPRR